MIARLIAFVMLALGAGSASQFPEYAQQYRQRLGGAVDELSVIVGEFDAAARSAGLTREEALWQYSEAGGNFLPERGNQMRRAINRFETLREQDTLLDQGGTFSALRVVLLDADRQVAEGALEDFRPAVPLTAEGLSLTAAGGALGLIFYQILAFGGRRLMGRNAESRAGASGTGRGLPKSQKPS
ncbi:MAG: DUF2937 family protein [Hyphomicrobiaceae bacterium]|nr:DUF2937 family protein [Hyphomicrobiaceae bacterium]